jgi:hypothetical protein
METSALGSLVGEELSGVGFIRDYIELYFDGPVLRLVGDVELRSPSSASLEGSLETGLVELIGSAVSAVQDANNAMEVGFKGGAKVCLRAASGRPEYANLITSDNKMIVWQPH